MSEASQFSPFILFTFLLVVNISDGVDDKVSAYIKNVIELHSSSQFPPSPLPFLRHCVPTSAHGDSSEEPAYFKYPVVIIWQPEVQFPGFFPHGIPCCEEHCGGKLVKTSFWTNGTTERKKPRTIHDSGEICLLVTVYYVCQRDGRHCFAATHPAVLAQFPDPAVVPFVLLHKAGITRDLLYQILKLVNVGMSFLEIELFLREVRRERHCQRYLSEYAYSRDRKLWPENVVPEHVDTPLSNDLLTHFYIEYFKENEEFFHNEMRKITASWLSCDHTFKVASNIGVLRNGKWMKQYDSLFAVMNEVGQVVTWQLVYGQSYSTIETLLTSLKARLDKKGCLPQGICIDNCCHWRNKLQKTFGSCIQVKLDIFHAVQRIGLAMSKKHPFHWRCLKEFSKIVRQDGDNGEERLQSTPSPEIILRNLREFLSKWSPVKYNGIPILTDKVHEEIKKLEKHINKGCLSNIPSGVGTNRNENMHRSLNKDLKKNRIGVILALAILTQFFYSWNQRKSTTPAKKGSIPPTISPLERKLTRKYLSEEDTREVFGIGINQRRVISEENEQNTCQPLTSNSEDLLNFLYDKKEHRASQNEEEDDQTKEHDITLDNNLVDILYRSVCMFNLAEDISSLTKSNSFEFRDLSFMDDLLKGFPFTTPNNDENHGDEHESRLKTVLKSYGFKRCPVEGDGDCLLAAIFHEVQRLLESDSVTTLSNHLNCIGLFVTTVPSEAVTKLRKLMVSEWLQNEEYYGLKNLYENEQDILAYEKPGVFGGGLGDAMPLGLANVLRLPIVMFTSIRNFPLVAISPREQVPDAKPIFLAYTQQGPGHYDIAKLHPISTQLTPEEKEASEKVPPLSNEVQNFGCRCGQGRDRKNLSKMRCQIPPGKFSCRCECFNRKESCSASCQCKNCGNIYGKRLEWKSEDIKRPRKRAKHASQSSKQSSLCFLKERGEGLKVSGWTKLEHCLFVHTLKHFEQTKDTFTTSDLHEMYNALVDVTRKTTNLKGLIASEKSEKEVSAKYTHHRKEAALFRSLLE